MKLFIATVVGGLTLGGIFSLIALGLVLILRSTDVFNFAHGQFMLLGAIVVGYWQNSMPIGLLLILGPLSVALVGALFYLLVLQWMVGRPMFLQVIATFGFAAALDGFMRIYFGTGQYVIKLPGIPTGSVKIFGAPTSALNLAMAGISFALALAVVLLLRFTRAGVRIRAAGQSALLAAHGGVRVKRVYVASWAAAGALAGIAGIAYGATNLVDFSIADLALLAIPAMLLGGLDSIHGALVGGIAIGLLQAFISSYLGGDVVNVATWSLLVLVLLIRPSGLFGTQRVARV